MALDIKQLIDDESGDREYFAMVPGLLWPDIKLCSGSSATEPLPVHIQELGAELDVYDKWLYASLKKICGEKGGQCFLSTRGLAKFAGMSIGQISKSKAKLALAGLIEIICKKRSAKGQAIDHIKVVDIWEENVLIMKARKTGVHLVNALEEKQKRSRERERCSRDEQIPEESSPGELKCSQGETEEEPIEEEPMSEEEKEEEPIPAFPEKPTADSLAPSKLTTFKPGTDYLGVASECAAKREEAGNYAVPAPAGGAFALADLALSKLYEFSGSEAPAEGKEHDRQRDIVAEVLKSYKCANVDPAVIEAAARLHCAAKGDFVNVYFKSFPADFGKYLGQAKAAHRDAATRRAHAVAVNAEALAARPARASPEPVPKDCPIGAQIKGQLSMQMDKGTYGGYVAPLRMVVEDGHLLVTAPDAFIRDWVENRLGKTIVRTLAGIKKGLAVEYELTSSDA